MPTKTKKVTKEKVGYCVPWCTGLSSDPRAVRRRLERLLEALANEISDHVVKGKIADDVRDFRLKLWTRLERDGYEVSWRESGNGRVRVRRVK